MHTKGRYTYMQGGSPTPIAIGGGARARRDQTLQICISGPTYAEVCMTNKPTRTHF